MKKMLFIFALAVLLLVAFAVPSLALHNPDPQARNCYYCHSTHAGIGPTLFNPNVGAKTAAGVIVNGSPAGIVTASTVCLACHDGTGHYKSVTGLNNTVMWQSGLFDLTKWPAGTGQEGANAASHTVNILADHFKTVGSAPGNKNLDVYLNTGDDLSCASCHNPHGNYTGVHAYMKVNPNDSIDGKFKEPYRVTPGWVSVLDGKTEATTLTLNRVGETSEYVVQNAADAPWLRTYISNRDSDTSKRYIKYPVAVRWETASGVWSDWTFNQLTTSSGTTATKNFSVNALEGKIRFDVTGKPGPGTATVQVKVFRPIMVSVTGTYTGKIVPEAGGAEVDLAGIRIYSSNLNRWCGACHGYYNITSRTDPNQIYTIDGVEYHGHNAARSWSTDYATPYSAVSAASTSRTGNCFSCHYAHGTRSDIMIDSEKQVIGARTFTAYWKPGSPQEKFVDMKPANKRYFGGSVCLRPDAYKWQ